MWWQRSRAMWLKDGARNTKYFHSRANQRRKKNQIKWIKRKDGSWAENNEQIEAEMVNYFQDLFQTSYRRQTWIWFLMQ